MKRSDWSPCTTALSRLPTGSWRGLSMVRVAPAWLLLSRFTSERKLAISPALCGSAWLVRTLPCSSVPTGIWLVSRRVRVAMLLALTCCTITARRLLSVWLTVIWLPGGSGWLALACNCIWLPLAWVRRSSIWKSGPTWRIDMTSARAVSPGPNKPGCGCSRRSSSPVMAALVAWGLAQFVRRDY